MCEPPADTHEAQRGREVHADLGPKGDSASADFIIDMHSTTANMGCTIIVNSYCDLALKAAAYLQEMWSSTDTEQAEFAAPSPRAPSCHRLA